MTGVLSTAFTDRDVVARLARRYLAPRWPALSVSIVCAAIFAVLSGLLLGILQPAVNDLIVHPKAGALGSIPPIIVALALGRGAAQVVQATLVNRIGNGIVGDIQLELFGKLVRADLARLRASHTGGFVSSVLYDAGLIREAATSGLVNFIQQGLTLLAAGAVMAKTDWKLGLFVLLAAPIVALFLRRYMRRATKAASGAMDATSMLSSAIMEGLDGVRVVKMENREAYEEGRVAAAIAERQRHIISGDNARAAAAPVSETLTMIVVAAVLAYEGWQAGAGRPNVGAFAAFFAALLTAGQALRQVSNLLTVLSQGLVAGRRLFGALDVEAEIGDAPGASPLARGEATIRLEGVSFSYGDETPVLKNLSLEARRGEIVALVGPSGAGKTTVLNLIPRFYDVTGGRLTVDGRDVREVTLASLRAQIALVTQEPFLFDDTIAANIAYAREGAGAAEIEAAAAAAAAHDFIVALPLGYETVVGELGARLSGGQRQRITIARAFLKDAPILLLDEATSALDAESEAQVQTALGRLMAGRTTLIIAHRLSTVRGADRIYVLDRGSVVEIGTHDALMEAGGLYARLARSQDLEHVADPGADPGADPLSESAL
ncbi:MAG: ABC transporter ATP-binding protein [Caulobacteraceae bacterium]